MTDNSLATDVTEEELLAAQEAYSKNFDPMDWTKTMRAALNAASRIRAETAKNSGEGGAWEHTLVQGDGDTHILIRTYQGNPWGQTEGYSVRPLYASPANSPMASGTIIVVDGTTKEGWRWPRAGDISATPANSRAEQDKDVFEMDISAVDAELLAAGYQPEVAANKARSAIARAISANSRAEAIGAAVGELLEHFQLVPMSAQQRKVYNNLRVLLQQEGE